MLLKDYFFGKWGADTSLYIVCYLNTSPHPKSPMTSEKSTPPLS